MRDLPSALRDGAWSRTSRRLRRAAAALSKRRTLLVRTFSLVARGMSIVQALEVSRNLGDPHRVATSTKPLRLSLALTDTGLLDGHRTRDRVELVARRGVGDCGAVVQNLVQYQYRPPARWLLEALTTSCAEWESPLVLDVGGHIGTAALYFAKLHPNIKTLSIEPERESFQLLQENIRTLGQDARAVNMAIGDGTRQVQVVGSGTVARTHSVAVDEGATSEAVGTTTISGALAIAQSFWPQSRLTPLVLKVDAEGAELDVFKDDIAWMFPVIVTEMHDFLDPFAFPSRSFSRGQGARERLMLVKGESVWSIDRAWWETATSAPRSSGTLWGRPAPRTPIGSGDLKRTKLGESHDR